MSQRELLSIDSWRPRGCVSSAKSRSKAYEPSGKSGSKRCESSAKSNSVASSTNRENQKTRRSKKLDATDKASAARRGAWRVGTLPRANLGRTVRPRRATPLAVEARTRECNSIIRGEGGASRYQ